jgi:hypothetical protein
VRLTCGPHSSVTGESSTPGSRNDVFHIRLTPIGAFIAVVNSVGRCPCETAVAAYCTNQANKSTSPRSPACMRCAGSIHSRPVITSAPRR